jgi:hypothetical protein
MVDEESQDVAPAPAGGAPVNRDRRGDPGVIDGEVAARVDDEAPAATAAETPRTEAPPRSAPPDGRAPGAGRAFAFGALGGLVVSALAAAGGYYALAPRADLAEADAGRLATLEAQAEREGEEVQRQSAAIAGFDKRLGALEASTSSTALAGLDKRLGALEAASAAGTSKIAAAAQAAQSLTIDQKSLRADVDAARGEIPGLAARVAKLESAAPAAAASAPEISALAGRLDKVEAALTAPKTETRVAPDKPAPGDNPAAVAIVAEALRDKLAAGIPFASELAALQSLGVQPERLAPLKALADGGPTDRALAASFDAVAPKVLAAASRPEGGGVVDRFLAHLRGLVQVRVLSETPGDDPAALVSQIEAESRRGDVSGALAAFGKLPEPARQAASGWAAEAGAKQAADEALGAIREAAIAKLAAGGKS